MECTLPPVPSSAWLWRNLTSPHLPQPFQLLITVCAEGSQQQKTRGQAGERGPGGATESTDLQTRPVLSRTAGMGLVQLLKLN